AILGIGVENETDEARPLSAYLQDALRRERPDDHILSVLDVACSHCITSRYLITNACRGCFARPCTFNCPRKAIAVVDGQARIDYSKCIDCGKCTQVCPYHAIIRVPVPCEEACPVNAIRRDEQTDRQYIDFDSCISCGKCMAACPFAAILERSQIIDVLKAITGGRKVVAMVAPAIIGQFAGKLGQIAAALRQAGFAHMEEVAYGAEMTTAHETAEFLERMKKGDHLMTTSCCPAYVEAVRRHVPELQPFVSDTASPMRYTAEAVKRQDPEAVTVFIGPCVAKRKEAVTDVNTDYVMTFEELGAMFAAMDIDVASQDTLPLERDIKGYARGFATSCGVSAAILEEMRQSHPEIEMPEINKQFINGLDRKAVKQLELYGRGKLPGNFLEVMACEGGCVGGPCAIGKVTLAAAAVRKAAAGDV
ncbi:MAG: monomeric [FeFe] hydrogenase, partial [Victivallales bacterium]|nr:monomeric [FeFe] hydrogenase [Victivallales bacterium]